MDYRVWQKPLYTRKYWHQMSWLKRIYYYMKPFLVHLLELWRRPLPCPTILKLCTSFVLLLLIFLPFLYTAAVLLLYYAIYQYFIQRIFDIEYPSYMNLLDYWNHLFYDEAIDDRYAFIVSMYLERWCHLVTAVTSLVDYTRLFACIMSA